MPPSPPSQLGNSSILEWHDQRRRWSRGVGHILSSKVSKKMVTFPEMVSSGARRLKENSQRPPPPRQRRGSAVWPLICAWFYYSRLRLILKCFLRNVATFIVCGMDGPCLATSPLLRAVRGIYTPQHLASIMASRSASQPNNTGRLCNKASPKRESQNAKVQTYGGPTPHEYHPLAPGPVFSSSSR